MKLTTETANELSKHIYNLAIQSLKIASQCYPSNNTQIHHSNLITAFDKIKHLAIEIGNALSTYEQFNDTEKLRKQIHAVIAKTLKEDMTYRHITLTDFTTRHEHKTFHQIKGIFEMMLRLIPLASHEANFSTSAKVDYTVIQSIHESLDAIQAMQLPSNQHISRRPLGIATLITLSRRNSGTSKSPPNSPTSDDELDNSQTFGPQDQAHRPYTPQRPQ